MGECRLYHPLPRPPATVVKRLGDLPTPAISDSQGRVGGAPGVHLIAPPGARMAGVAFTVRTRPGDNLVVHKGLELAEPGDVLVIDAGGATDRAILGQLVCLYAESRGIAGMVVDGAVRDVEEMRAGTLPVFARAVTHLGPYRSGPGALRGPISLAGTPVHFGDIVVGDADGVVVVPRDGAEELAERAEGLVKRDHEQERAIREGRWDRSWIDSLLTYTDSAQP